MKIYSPILVVVFIIVSLFPFVHEQSPSDVALNDEISLVARTHSLWMAANDQLLHTVDTPDHPQLLHLVPGQKVGEIVGRGPTPRAIFNSFMDSPEHSIVINDPDFKSVGVSAVQASDDHMYITAIFSDVEGTAHSEGIAWAYKNNIMQGYDDVTFRPNQELTRGQFATTLKNLSDKGVISE